MPTELPNWTINSVEREKYKNARVLSFLFLNIYILKLVSIIHNIKMPTKTVIHFFQWSSPRTCWSTACRPTTSRCSASATSSSRESSSLCSCGSTTAWSGSRRRTSTRPASPTSWDWWRPYSWCTCSSTPSPLCCIWCRLVWARRSRSHWLRAIWRRCLSEFRVFWVEWKAEPC